MGETRKEVTQVYWRGGNKRLKGIFRGYPLKKIQENNESEIMQTVLDEAKSSYSEEIIVELDSEGTEDLDTNVARIVAWIEAWRRDRGFDDERDVQGEWQIS
jgi:broad-specificity NMP kinase